MTAVDIARRVLPLIDLTLLGDNDTPEQVEALCDAAITPHGHVAAVCVWPEFVGTAVRHLADSAPRVAAVANFPQGSTDVDAAIADALTIVEAGGDEVDVVLPWRALVDGNAGVGTALVEGVREAIPDTTLLKVILETGEIGDPDVIRAAALEAIAGGADFLKTSSGKTSRSATPEAARQLFELASTADRPIGVKVSGGVRSLDDAAQYLEIADDVLGADQINMSTMRIGASSLLGAVLDALRDECMT